MSAHATNPALCKCGHPYDFHLVWPQDYSKAERRELGLPDVMGPIVMECDYGNEDYPRQGGAPKCPCKGYEAAA
jgi:hypothetical protein